MFIIDHLDVNSSQIGVSADGTIVFSFLNVMSGWFDLVKISKISYQLGHEMACLVLRLQTEIVLF